MIRAPLRELCFFCRSQSRLKGLRGAELFVVFISVPMVFLHSIVVGGTDAEALVMEGNATIPRVSSLVSVRR